MSDPEARGVAERASAQLQRLSDHCAELKKLKKASDKETVVHLLLNKVNEVASASFKAVSASS